MNQWANEANQKKWMEWAAEQLGIENITQWKDVTYDRIQHIRGIRFVKTFGKSLLHSLERVYPGNLSFAKNFHTLKIFCLVLLFMNFN